ncbi:uncharacterized protein LOC143284919 isoform X2 [Babylonia areolata]|uniref:uncharacterized protein LOC143284919 isoform X2 n=1 Tax=Babylonia areolata TaxID=304850 RepID=UPI003FD4E54C
MAHFGRDDSFSAARTVQITGSETNENFTTYTIEMTVDSCTWTVRHRYSEFHELHEKLVASHKVDKGLLPPKKLFGNQTESFVKKRQHDLQLYLQTVLNLLAVRPPPALTSFLHFHLYEIHGITQTMAEDLYNRGEMLLQSNEVFRVTPLQLHSLTERLKLPEPTCDSGDVKKDLGHILDFITRTKHLQIRGRTELVGTSNINMNLLPFDLSLFKSIQSLELQTADFGMVRGLETIKQTLTFLKVFRSASTIKEVVLQDVPQWKGEDGSELVGGWDHVTRVDFSHNFIKDIDSSVQILWRVEHLDLSHNQLEGVEHLQWLSHMTHLDLSHNRLHSLTALHTKLGNLKCLLLQGNHIESLHGFSKLFSLEVLNVSNNKIAKVEDVRPVCQLPCMESLRLTDNPVTMTVDYRTRILEMFGDRVGEVSLDGEKASQKEKDTVAVRLALQKAKDARSRQAGPRKIPSAASFSALCSIGQGGQRGSGSQMSTSAPHHSLPHQWSHSDLRHHTHASIFIPGRSSPGQVSSSSRTSVQETWGAEGVDLPSPIPEAHPFDPSSDPMPSPPAKRKEYSVADLPTTTCLDFVRWLEKQAPLTTDTTTTSPPMTTTTTITTSAITSAPPSLGPDPARSANKEEIQQQVVSVLWCYAQLYTSPAVLSPCCAVLTSSTLQLHRLSGSGGAGGFPGCPRLRPSLALPLNSVQHVVVGPGYAYLRVEEAFVGSGGLFTLFAVDLEAMRGFAEALQDCCTQLDPSNPPDVLDLLCQSDLLTELCHREKRRRAAGGGSGGRGLGGGVSDYLAMTLLVWRRREGEEEEPCLLVMSENVVYLLDTACVYWPPATFQSVTTTTAEGRGGGLCLGVREEVSIVGDVTDTSLHPHHQNSEGSRAGKNRVVDFTPQPLTLHLQGSDGPRQLCLLFSAASSREMFVDRLNNLRARHHPGHLTTSSSSPTRTPPTAAASNGSDLADSSFQTCRSHGSSLVCNGDGAPLLSTSAGSVTTHPGSLTDHQPLLPTTFTDAAPGPVNTERVSDLSVGSGGGDQPEAVVSVEAEVHSDSVLSLSSSVQGQDGASRTALAGQQLEGDVVCPAQDGVGGQDAGHGGNDMSVDCDSRCSGEDEETSPKCDETLSPDGEEMSPHCEEMSPHCEETLPSCAETSPTGAETSPTGAATLPKGAECSGDHEELSAHCEDSPEDDCEKHSRDDTAADQTDEGHCQKHAEPCAECSEDCSEESSADCTDSPGDCIEKHSAGDEASVEHSGQHLEPSEEIPGNAGGEHSGGHAEQSVQLEGEH